MVGWKFHGNITYPNVSLHLEFSMYTTDIDYLGWEMHVGFLSAIEDDHGSLLQADLFCLKPSDFGSGFRIPDH